MRKIFEILQRFGKFSPKNVNIRKVKLCEIVKSLHQIITLVPVTHYKCCKCDKFSSNESDLKDHIKLAHRNNPNIIHYISYSKNIETYNKKKPGAQIQSGWKNNSSNEHNYGRLKKSERGKQLFFYL